MSIYKRNGSPFWYYSYTINGKKVEGSTKTKNKTLAKQIAATRKSDFLRNQNEIKITTRMSFDSQAKEFLEWSKSNKRSYRRDVILVMHLSRFFGKKDISDISSLDVETYKQRRIKSVSGSTVNREVACLKRMFNLAIRWEYAERNPVKDVEFFREPKRNFRWFPEEEIEKFLMASNGRMKSIFLIGINTGMRISELLNLKWNQIDFANNYITIEESKTDEYRKVKMNSKVIGVLKGLERKAEFVFVNNDGQPFQRITKAFKGTCKRAGVKPATPHAMRHTFASHLMKLGVDPYTIMELGGWKSLEMVMRYSHLAPDHTQHAVNKLAEMKCQMNS